MQKEGLFLKKHLKTLALSSKQRTQIFAYWKAVFFENQTQNLTRMISGEEFFLGHVLDLWWLFKSQLLQTNAIDIGSGLGVPGLLYALLETRVQWILVESEIRKAQFLKKLVLDWNLNHVTVFYGRVEEFFKKESKKKLLLYPTLVFRAVAPLARMYRWVHSCSTWNKWIAFKGPRWKEEWKDLEKLSKNEMILKKKIFYQIKEKKRALLMLERVPRGTS